MGYPARGCSRKNVDLQTARRRKKPDCKKWEGGLAVDIWGHRGAYHFAPENTLKSFELAAEMGADGVELDIQLTRDGEIVVIHDETVDRTSNGKGYVKDYTLSELKRLNFNKRGITSPQFMEIPTLREALELLAPTGLEVNIELKTGCVWYEDLAHKAMRLVKEFSLADKTIWSSFNYFSLRPIKILEPCARVALLCGGGILATGEICEKIGAEALHCQLEQLSCPGFAEDCKARGIKLRPWTVDEEDDVLLCAALGVDAVITNRIDIAKKALEVARIE
jgi:glycerophosphoryl diester phosphodiesterase